MNVRSTLCFFIIFLLHDASPAVDLRDRWLYGRDTVTSPSGVVVTEAAVIKSTVNDPSQTSQPPTLIGYSSISGDDGYFWVSDKCTAEQKQKYVRAYQDSQEIGKGATKWPAYGTDASDLYMGKGADMDASFVNYTTSTLL